jgi:hypothetical protein
MEYDSLRTFRARLKEAFDYVESGSEEGDLIIHRNGTTFKLVLDSWQVAEESVVSRAAKEIVKPKPLTRTIPKIINEPTSSCKNGHFIPPGRSKCLGKGCKYS